MNCRTGVEIAGSSAEVHLLLRIAEALLDSLLGLCAAVAAIVAAGGNTTNRK